MITWDDVAKWAATLPETTVESWYRTPGLKVAGKGFARFRSDEEGGVVVFCSLEDKERYLSSGNDAFYTTPHYDGYGAVIVDLDLVNWDDLVELLSASRDLKAPKRLQR